MYIGIDIGSSTTKIVQLDGNGNLCRGTFSTNQGRPLQALRALLDKTLTTDSPGCCALGITGSGRKLGARCLAADTVVNEITAIWRAATSIMPDVASIIEIGGQDSKFITLEHGEISQFRLNSVCAAGTGSFLMQQSTRLGLSLPEMSEMACRHRARPAFPGAAPFLLKQK
jgi:activator of 2-hydroxyglutaryl-CoA dehydratase